MNLDDLREARELIIKTYNNLNDHQWIANELNHLKAKYDILTEVINKGEQSASSKAEPSKTKTSHKRTRK